MNVPNSYFFLNIFKNRLKWIKDPNLHDSQFFLNNENDSIPPRSQRQRGEFFHSRCRYSGGMSSLHMDWTALRKLFFSKK